MAAVLCALRPKRGYLAASPIINKDWIVLANGFVVLPSVPRRVNHLLNIGALWRLGSNRLCESVPLNALVLSGLAKFRVVAIWLASQL